MVGTLELGNLICLKAVVYIDSSCENGLISFTREQRVLNNRKMSEMSRSGYDHSENIRIWLRLPILYELQLFILGESFSLEYQTGF